MRYVQMLICLLLLNGFAAPQALQAQESPELITLKKALWLAQRHNVELQRSANNLTRQSLQTQRSRIDAFLPSLSLSTGGSQRYGLTFDQTAGRLVQRQSQYLNTGTSARLTLFNGFGDVSRLQQAEAQRDAAVARHERTAQQTTHQVLQRFLQVILDKKVIDIRQENVEAQRAQMRLVRGQITAGTKPPSDSLQQAERLAGSRVELLEARRTLELSKTRLIQTLGIDPMGSYEFAMPDVEETPPAELPFDLQELYRQALTRRSDVAAQKDEIRAAEETIDITRSWRWPSLSVRGSFGTSYTSAGQAVLPSQFANNRSGSFGFGFSVPLSSQLTIGKDVEQAQVDLENEQLALEGLRHEVMLEVRQAYLDYQLLAERLQLAEKRLASARAAWEAERQRYELGLSSLPVLAETRARLVSAQVGRARALYELAFQRKTIDYQTGQLDAAVPAPLQN